MEQENKDSEQTNKENKDLEEDHGKKADEEIHHNTHPFEEPGKKSNGNFKYFFMIFIPLVLLGSAGLGGFWCYTKIVAGMISSETITDLGLKMKKLESQQKELLNSLAAVESKLDKVGMSSSLITGVPEILNSLDQKLALLSQAVSRIPVQQGVSSNEGGFTRQYIPGEQSISGKRQKTIKSNTEFIKKAPLRKENDLEKFIKFLFASIGDGLFWVYDNLKHIPALISELLK